MLVAETENDLVEGLGGWRDGMESGSMRVGVSGTRVVVGGRWSRLVQMAAGVGMVSVQISS